MARLALFALAFLAAVPLCLHGDDGYRLWLRYDPIVDASRLAACRAAVAALVVPSGSATGQIVHDEIEKALTGFTGAQVPVVREVDRDGVLVIGTPKNSPLITALPWAGELSRLGSDGFRIRSLVLNGHKATVIAAGGEIGMLYGTFEFLRRLQTGQSLVDLNLDEHPAFMLRVLDHWDNLDGTVERGYAGRSIWPWSELPGKSDERLRDYARANASIGINGAVLNNVNATSDILDADYLAKVAAIANTLRPYGIRVYLSARYSAPMEGNNPLTTADPLDPGVAAWWKKKADEIYALIPDFGGFLVKADSEGQPGPLTYHRTHADGANMLAAAVAPHGGVIMWRAFVYGAAGAKDRAAQAYDQMRPLDGSFAPNVLLQVKYGPLDFQPREPFHPLYGAMPKTQLMGEVEITQEYLGHDNHLVYLAPLWHEWLDSDTRCLGAGSTVRRVLDGDLYRQRFTGIAGVANIGDDRNWCGHLFAQANWYAFGRLTWDPSLSSEQIAREWIAMTLTPNPAAQQTIDRLMLGSYEAAVSYFTPLGLSFLVEHGNHYSPAPAQRLGKSIETGIGFDLTSNDGANGVGCYQPQVSNQFASLSDCPEKYLLWFHHVPWDYKMHSGNSVWDELCRHYQAGVDWVKAARRDWDSLQGMIDPKEFNAVAGKLAVQEKDAEHWRNVCLSYFQTGSKMPYPAGVDVTPESEKRSGHKHGS